MNISFGDILFLLIRCSFFKLSNTTFLFSWWAGHRVKKWYSSSISSLNIGHILSTGFLKGLKYRPVSMASTWLLNRNFVNVIMFSLCYFGQLLLSCRYSFPSSSIGVLYPKAFALCAYNSYWVHIICISQQFSQSYLI